jgi:hypothetical protein
MGGKVAGVRVGCDGLEWICWSGHDMLISAGYAGMGRI